VTQTPTVLVILGSIVISCASNPPRAKNPTELTDVTQLPAALRAEIPGLLAREFPGNPTLRFISAFDGNVVATLHSEDLPSLDCRKDDGKVTQCGLRFTIAEKYAKWLEPSCSITESHAPLSEFIPWPKKNAILLEPPHVQVTAIGSGVAMHIVVDYIMLGKYGDHDPILLTWKLSLLFKDGYSVACIDSQAGYKQTYAKSIDELFQSFNVKKSAALRQDGYSITTSGKTIGFQVQRLYPQKAGREFTEVLHQFALRSIGNQLDPEEVIVSTQRDTSNRITKQQTFRTDRDGTRSVESSTGSDGAQFVSAVGAQGKQDSRIDLPLTLETIAGLQSSFAALVVQKVPDVTYSTIEWDNGLVVARPHRATLAVDGSILLSSPATPPATLRVNSQGLVELTQVENTVWKLLRPLTQN
jgi:hypothetical protein